MSILTKHSYPDSTYSLICNIADVIPIFSLIEPRPRNQALADAMKRIGVVERSGRGVDKIYRGLLRFGRPVPDYSRTDSLSVVVSLATGAADLPFLRMVVEQDGQYGQEMPIDSLIALAALHEQKRLGTQALARHIQRNAEQARRTLEQLVERGLAEAHGTGRGRTYTLSAAMYRAEGKPVAYTRQAGFSALQNEQMVLGHVRHHGKINRSQVAELCRLTARQATLLLARLVNEGKLVRHGERRWTVYVDPTNAGDCL